MLDGLYPFDRAVERSVRAGVTCACVCPGSDGVIGGVASVIRLTGKIADEMIVTRKAAVKGSLGETRRQLSMDSPHAWVLLITYVSVWKIRRNIF